MSSVNRQEHLKPGAGAAPGAHSPTHTATYTARPASPNRQTVVAGTFGGNGKMQLPGKPCVAARFREITRDSGKLPLTPFSRRSDAPAPKRARSILLFVASFLILPVAAFASVPVITAPNATAREKYGAGRLSGILQNVTAPSPADAKVIVAVRGSPLLARYPLAQFWPGATEAFLLKRIGDTWIVAGSDPSGVLYGSLELADRIQKAGALPIELDFEDHPSLKLRGTCIGMQKTEITYEGAEYDYPYTPENFPFFYDKAAWIRYLDFLAEGRMNTLYLWNGHPFTSLLKLPRYPEAQELPDAQLDQNIAMFRWLTEEADRRGIWVVQGFYNIHLSHTFARAHGVAYHLSQPTPLASAYTRYVISQFIQQYPNVGLLITLGEAMAPQYGAEWMSQTIIPGVKDGLAALGTTTEPPIVVRAHATDIKAVMDASLPLYHNIDTMEKWTGESLTWTDVRGSIRDKDVMLAELAPIDVSNVHILANLEPFRWGDPDYIRECILSFQKIGISGLHLYPLRYWDWPYSADNTQPLLQQIDRDWIWFEAWARYAWNPNRDPGAEHAYWVHRFAEKFGGAQAGEHLLAAYELSGPCAPRLLPRIGITEGNREAFSLGLLMPQLIDADRYHPEPTLWTGDAPDGERLDDYVQREFTHQPHVGETPIGVAAEVADSSAEAVEEAEEAGPYVTRDREEYERILNDTRCIHALMQYYNAKTQAAALVMLYGCDHNLDHLAQAEKLLADSVDFFRTLAGLTDTTYRQAAALLTEQRQIPFSGAAGKYAHWRDVLPEYERELAIFQARLAWLQTSSAAESASTALPQVQFHLESDNGETFTLQPGAGLFTDGDSSVTQVAPELLGLTGIRISQEQSRKDGVALRVDLDQPAQVLIGFFKLASESHPPADPQPDTWQLQMLSGVDASKLPDLAVWSRALPAGTSTLDVGRGPYVVLGFIPANTSVGPPVYFRDSQTAQPPDLDWLFEN
jgi:hypothetical protein